jgi:hypothetical protein
VLEVSPGKKVVWEYVTNEEQPSSTSATRLARRPLLVLQR